MRTALHSLVFLFAFAAAPLGSARNWAIQAFAFGSAAQAETVVSQLRSVGFDAYTSAADTLNQVRIGCFDDQNDAEALAQDVRQRVALDAQVVPFTAGDDATVCVARQLGFIPPLSWGIESTSASSVTFWLEANGRHTITFDGERWTLGQVERDPLGLISPFGEASGDSLAGLLDDTPAMGLAVTFRATQSRGLPILRADLAGGSLLLTSGKLLWASTRAAVVEEGTDVFALRLYRP